MVTLRPMVEKDIPAALALWQGVPGLCLRDADSPPALARFLRRNPGLSFAAVVGPELVGVSLAGHDGRRGYLHHVAVAGPHRRRGVGGRLVAACLDALAGEGVAKVHLLVKADNADGMAFWRRVGGRERADVRLVSILRGDDANA